MRNIIDVNYPAIQSIINYLEKEDSLKKDLNVMAPSQKVS